MGGMLGGPAFCCCFFANSSLSSFGARAHKTNNPMRKFTFELLQNFQMGNGLIYRDGAGAGGAVVAARIYAFFLNLS